MTRATVRPRSRWPRIAFSRRALWGICLVAIGAGLFTGYLHQARVTDANSDGAAMVLQAWDMLHGNVLLHGWSLADVSFYPTEVPEDALVELFTGLRPDVVHISAALTYTLIVLLTALLARGRTRGREGVLRAVIGGMIVVAPSVAGTRVLLLSPNHTGTAVPVLLTLLVLDRTRSRWQVPVLVGALLTLTQVADQIAAYAVAAPLALVGAVRSARLRSRHDAWLALAGAASVPGGLGVLWLIHAAGGFYEPPLTGSLLAAPSQLPGHFGALAACVRILFGVGSPGGFLGFVAVLHAVCLGLAGLGLLAGLVRLARIGLASQVLVAGIVAVLAAGFFGTHVTSTASAHEIAVVLPMSAALTARMVPAAALRGRPVLGVAPAAAGLAACFLAALAIAASWSPARPDNAALARWLQAHGLHTGLSGYWQADSAILDSGGGVLIAPVQATADGKVQAYRWETQASWFDSRATYANFVVEETSAGSETMTIPHAVLYSSFGRPARIWHFKNYTITVWKENLLAHLSP
jgi:hypothetical protein